MVNILAKLMFITICIIHLQEALLDIKLRFSDNTWVKLDEIDKENYVLAVDSLEPSVVELPPIQNSKYPRIIAVSEGGGPIMRCAKNQITIKIIIVIICTYR